MKEYQIICDSSCDLPEDLVNEFQIIRVPFYITFDKSNYKKDLSEITREEFYLQMAQNNERTGSSPPSAGDYVSVFKEVIQQEKDILCICLSARFSGSYQSALNAKSRVDDEYDEAAVEVVSSCQLSVCEGITVLQAAYMKKEGYTLQETKKRLYEMRSTSRLFFAVQSMEQLKNSGWWGKISSFTGALFHLKSIFQVKSGEISAFAPVVSSMWSVDKIMHIVRDYFKDNKLDFNDYEFAVISGPNINEAEVLKSKLEELLNRPIRYPVFITGAVIASNVGTGVFGVGFIEKYNCKNQEKE